MGYAKRRYQQYKRNPLVRFGQYPWGAAGALSGAALGYIRNSLPGVISGGGAGYGAGVDYYKRNYRLKKRDFKKKLGVNKVMRSNFPYTKLIGSNPGHVFGSNPGPNPKPNPNYKYKYRGVPIFAKGAPGFKHKYRSS